MKLNCTECKEELQDCICGNERPKAFEGSPIEHAIVVEFKKKKFKKILSHSKFRAKLNQKEH